MAVRSFNETRQLENDYNQASNKDIINGWHQRNNTNRYYIIDDKQTHKLGVYRNGQLVAEFDAIHGKNNSVEGYTFKKRNSDGTTTDTWASADDMTISYTKDDGTVDNLSGNLSTPAGMFYSNWSNIYNGAPGMIRQTKDMLDRGKGESIPAGIHVRTITPGANTNGCTGLSKESLWRLQSILGNATNIETYIIPINEDNKFFIENNQLWFKNFKNRPEVSSYYKQTIPSEIAGFTYNDLDLEENQKQMINQFGQALIDYKDTIIKALNEYGYRMNSNAYNELALQALGILGAESNYGRRKNGMGNLFGLVGKAFGMGGPDYWSKYYTFKQNKENDSIGPTQIRWKWINSDVKNILSKYFPNLNAESTVLFPDAAAIVTMLRLAQEEYNKKYKRTTNAGIYSWNKDPNYYNNVANRMENRKFDWQLNYSFKRGGKLNKLTSFIRYKNGGTTQASPFTKDNLRNTFSAWFTDDQVNKMNKMYNHMKNSLRWSDRNIAAAFGNIMQETAFKYLDDWGISPFGAFQFLGDRKKHFEKWAQDNGYKLGSLSAASYIDYVIKNAIDGRMDDVIRARELAQTGNKIDSINAAKTLSWAEDQIKKGTFYPVADLTAAWDDDSLDLGYITKLFANTIERAKDFEMNMNERVDSAHKIYSLIKQ